ncbi:NADH:flavin oxidoreductase [Acidaminobacter sp. JC074]|uniref:NADH:flavin oxidoreductase n=1 Tax=Acidaminobacter sp. JC074 TaxID=2530199 RepID=UPI001F1113C5|nr:NADH:flavin oxidoreductase [Acidaminobacter sp. JC074]MCH4890184.1 NADH:flavin oxidoreductase [Acidaminobacter sp. JC074]
MKVFKKNKLGSIELKNRFVRSAAGSGVASKEGFVTYEVKDWYRKVASGGAGLLITEMMTVWDDSNFPEYYLRVDDDKYIKGLKELADISHSYRSGIVAQIGNYGSLLHWEPNKIPVGPSNVKDAISCIEPHALSEIEINDLVNYFIEAAKRVKEADFDGVQVHAAHGFLLNKFINPYYNNRKDRYGGSTENRSRIIVEIVDGIKKACGKDFLVLLKLNSDDYVNESYGFKFDEARKVASYLSNKGFDGYEITSGLAGGRISPARPLDEEAYNLKHAKIISEENNLPVILVGGIRSLTLAEKILNETSINSIGMTRALTYKPDLINEWMNGEQVSKCIACNKCFVTDGQLCIFNINKEAI